MSVKYKIEEIDPRGSKYLTLDEVDKIKKLLDPIVSKYIAKSPIHPKGMITTDVKMFATKLIPGKGIINWFRKFFFVRGETVRLILKIGDEFAVDDLDSMIFMKCSFEEMIRLLEVRAQVLVYRALR